MPTEPRFLLFLPLLISLPSMHAPTQSAQARWQSIILADAPSVNEPDLDLTANFFPGFSPYFGFVDDIIVFYELASLGPGILGQAGPIYIRLPSAQPISALMRFSIDFFNADQITEDVILHEMAHALGFGTVSAQEKGKQRLELP